MLKNFIKIYKKVKEFSPDFKINIIWQNAKLSHVYSPRNKLSVPYFMQTGVIYNFKCDCGAEYIGETKRAFRKRIMEHHIHKKAAPSPIYKHIYTDQCPTYQTNLNKNYGSKPSKSQEIMFFQNHFKIVARNLHNYSTRTDMEAIIIRLRQPDLNLQVQHKTVLPI